MTSMLHVGPDPFDAQLRLAQLRSLAASGRAAAGLAENYAGPPLIMTERNEEQR